MNLAMLYKTVLELYVDSWEKGNISTHFKTDGTGNG